MTGLMESVLLQIYALIFYLPFLTAYFDEACWYAHSPLHGVYLMRAWLHLTLKTHLHRRPEQHMILHSAAFSLFFIPCMMDMKGAVSAIYHVSCSSRQSSQPQQSSACLTNVAAAHT